MHRAIDDLPDLGLELVVVVEIILRKVSPVDFRVDVVHDVVAVVERDVVVRTSSHHVVRKVVVAVEIVRVNEQVLSEVA